MAQYLIGQRHRGSGIEMPGIAGEALPRGAAIYMSAVDGLWYLADADTVATLPVVGVSLDQTAVGRVFQIIIVGIIGRSTWTWTRGDPIYVSGTPGVLTQVAPANLQPVAIALTATDIYVNPGAAGASATCGLLAGATAYVGFDECKEPFTNYFLCDNVADDVEIQAALDYVEALGGGTVLVERGGSIATRYDITAQLEIGSFTTLMGDGITAFVQNVTTFFLANGVDDDMITNKAAAIAIGIRNLYLIGNSANQVSGSAINIDAMQSEIAFNHINDFKENGLEINDGEVLVERNLFDNIDNDAIQLLDADCHIIKNNCTADRYGIYINGGTNHISENNVFLCGSHGIFGDTGSDGSTINDNRVNNCTGWGIDSVGEENLVIDNRVTINEAGGIRIRASTHAVVGNISRNNGGSGLDLTGSAQRTVVTGNAVFENDGHGILLTDQEYITVTGNTIMNNGQDGVFTSGIFVFFNASSRYNVISANICSDDQGVETQDYGIRIDTGVTDVSVIDNICEGNDVYGVWIETGAIDILVKNNLLLNNGTAAIQDDGTDTKLATLPIQLMQGTTFISTPGEAWGWEIDANAEFALGIGWLPLELQQVVRIRVIGVGLAAPGAGNQMRIELTGEGATFAEIFSTNSIDVVNKNSEEINFAIDDVVQWIFDATDDADIGNLLGGDRLQIKLLHEAAGDGDIATDCIVDTIAVEFV